MIFGADHTSCFESAMDCVMPEPLTIIALPGFVYVFINFESLECKNYFSWEIWSVKNYLKAQCWLLPAIHIFSESFDAFYVGIIVL